MGRITWPLLGAPGAKHEKGTEAVASIGAWRRNADASRLPRLGWVEGFHWLRHGQPVSEGEGYTIGQAFHHNARNARKGTPEPKTLDGITRHFTLCACACGTPGIGPMPAGQVEAALEQLHVAGRHEVDCRELCGMTGATPNRHPGAAGPT